MPPAFSLTETPLSTSEHFRCTLPRSLQLRNIAVTPFPRHTRLSASSRSFTLCPPPLAQRPVPPSVLLSGAVSRIAILPCTLLSPLLYLTLRTSQHLLTLSSGRLGARVARPILSHALSALPQNSSMLATPLSHLARLLSLQCRHTGAYLDTVPINQYLCLFDGDFINGYHFFLGVGR
jgi:hypothetical protein